MDFGATPLARCDSLAAGFRVAHRSGSGQFARIPHPDGTVVKALIRAAKWLDENNGAKLILMTDGPELVGDVLHLTFPRPRRRVEVLDHPAYYPTRTRIIDFLENHARQLAGQ
jgi:hypothetical protein